MDRILEALPPGDPIALFPGCTARLVDANIGVPPPLAKVYSAYLIIHPGCVTASLSRWPIAGGRSETLVQQYDGEVRIQSVRCGVPWQNTFVWIKQDDQLAMLLLSGRRRRALRSALTTSGLGYQETKPLLGGTYYLR